MNRKPTTVDEYLNQLPEPALSKMIELRAILHSVSPAAREGIKWGRPVFESKVILYSYTAFKRHISFFPTGSALAPFAKEIKENKIIMNQDSIQLAYDQDLPIDLIRHIATYRLEDVELRGAKWRY